MGPPEDDAAREAHQTYPGTSVKGLAKTHTRHPKGTTAGLRYAAARRLPPLAPCGCRRDPLTDRHRCDDEISDRQLQAAVQAAHHILGAGYLPIFDLPTLRELWRGGHHQLVDELRGGGR